MKAKLGIPNDLVIDLDAAINRTAYHITLISELSIFTIYLRIQSSRNSLNDIDEDFTLLRNDVLLGDLVDGLSGQAIETVLRGHPIQIRKKHTRKLASVETAGVKTYWSSMSGEVPWGYPYSWGIESQQKDIRQFHRQVRR